VPVGSRPHGIAFSGDGSYAFVANRYSGAVSVIDTSVPAVTATIPVGSQPYSIASSPCLD
jgi:YVTN family beta-propeller protein